MDGHDGFGCLGGEGRDLIWRPGQLTIGRCRMGDPTTGSDPQESAASKAKKTKTFCAGEFLFDFWILGAFPRASLTSPRGVSRDEHPRCARRSGTG